MYDKLFANMILPVRPEMAADGASIRVEEIVAEEVGNEMFFGGYAEDFLADLGLDIVESMPEKAVAKKIQG
jgi:hypothetical protein